jgi:hypothetical protein
VSYLLGLGWIQPLLTRLQRTGEQVETSLPPAASPATAH